MRHLVALVVLALPAGVLHAAPDPAWTVALTQTDCSGSAQQATPACDDYSTDFYENVDYTVAATAITSDIQTTNYGFDSTYFYFEYDFVGPYDPSNSTGHQVVIELDVDAATETNRADYYVGLFQKSEFNTTTWIDAYVQGGYEVAHDDNDDVGGPNPTTSDFGGSPGDGYDNVVSQAADQVWARVVNGNFQVAIKRTLIGSPSRSRARLWSRQSTSLSKDKLYFHDQNAVADVVQIDNTAGLPLDGWSEVLPFLIVKAAFEIDGTPIPDGSSSPRGILIRFMVYIDNQSGAVNDISLQDILAASFQYQSGSMKIANLAGASTTWCPAGVCDESLIFNEVETNGTGLGDGDSATPPIDADVGSFDTPSATVDIGDENNPNNAQLDIIADSVLAVIFTVKML